VGNALTDLMLKTFLIITADKNDICPIYRFSTHSN